MRIFKWLAVGLLFCVVSVWAKVNINTASVDELQTLKGIGAAKAASIVAYRKEHGSFDSVEKLLEVKGIGPAILKKNRDEIEITSNNTNEIKNKKENNINKKSSKYKTKKSSSNSGKENETKSSDKQK